MFSNGEWVPVEIKPVEKGIRKGTKPNLSRPNNPINIGQINGAKRFTWDSSNKAAENKMAFGQVSTETQLKTLEIMNDMTEKTFKGYVFT